MADNDKVKRLLAEYPALQGDQLSLADLPVVRMATHSVGYHWYNLGIYLHVPAHSMDGFGSKYRQNTDRCLTAVLAEWLKNETVETTWATVVAAIASRVGGDNPAEARNVAKNYQRLGLTSEYKKINEVDDRPLSSRDLMAVKDALMQGVADKWVAIALQLGIPYHRLETYELEDTLQQRITAMVRDWLEKRYDCDRFGLPSWRKLVGVIASRSGGSHNYLANQLASQHPYQPHQPEPPSTSVPPRATGPEKPSDALSESDLGTLLTLLRPVVAKWNILAVQLDIPMSQIQEIMAKPMLMATAPLSYLQEVLYIWLTQRPPDKQWPTVRKLTDALGGDVMDEEVLAVDVGTQLLSR